LIIGGEQMERERLIKLERLIKVVSAGVVTILAVIFFNPLSCVGPNQRGVKIRFGAAMDAVLLPGIQNHIPVVEKIKLYSIVPSEIKMEIPVGPRGAITRDNQTVGTIVTVFWRYDEDRIDDVAKNYTEERIKSIIRSIMEAAVKNTIGQYTIFDLALTQTEITEKIKTSIETSFFQYPLLLTDVQLNNYDWGDEFDKQITDTMIRAQEVRQKDQELEIAKLESQKNVVNAQAERDAQIARAEGAKQAEITRAEGEKERIRLEGEAKVLEGEGLRLFNNAVAGNATIEIRLRELAIEKLKVERWDGHYVPNNMYGPIPVDANGGIQGR
jgi:regulator of protease activity HflC (stomatin/prohibitin superfamily)